VGRGRIHQFLWRPSRAVSKREQGTLRRGAIRNRSQPEQVVQAGFEPERIAVTQRVIGCYCASARGGRLWRGQSTVCHRPKKITERWTNRAHAPGRTRRRGRSRENLPSAGDVINQHRWPVNEKQPESEEARPVALANALSKAVADQCQTVKTRKRNHGSVLTWFASRWRNHQPKRAEKPHSKFNAARRWTALLRGRRLRLPWGIASGS